MIFEISPEARDRLTRLAIYLDTLPKDYRDFDMAHFFMTKKKDKLHELERKYALENGGVGKCGTSACAVGHGPSAGIKVPYDMISKNYLGEWDIEWTHYSRLFTDDQSGLFDWMFGGDWSEIDNHHYGAAARIKYVLMGLDTPDISSFTLENYQAILDSYAPYRKRKHSQSIKLSIFDDS